MDHEVLYIPGPVEVKEDVLKACAKPMIGHRTQAMKDLYASIKVKLKTLLYTENAVLVSTSSGSGFMESAMRNLVKKKVLNCVNGAFSKKWYDIAVSCGKDAEKLEVDYGKAIKPEMVDEKLKTGEFDAICITHNETSTGVMNNLEELSGVVRKYPDVLFLVDAVSSMSGVKIEVDKLGIDMCLASSQKAFALPPGLAVAAVSEKAFKKAETVDGRGYYFDLIGLKKSYDKDQTPYTPVISLMYGLDYQLDKMMAEGIDARFERHKKLAEKTREWAKEMGYEIFPEPGYESVTMTCIVDTKGMDLKKMQGMMREKGYSVDKGYRKLNEKLEKEGRKLTFRIAHMGDTTEQDLDELLNAFEDVIGKL
ncbi:MAG: alanine--glyoxylate aminotransferase family protein [Candidatus Micrarchaeota archaeon]